EGIKGKRAVEWRLVDEVVPASRLEAAVAGRMDDQVSASGTADAPPGIVLVPLYRKIAADRRDYQNVSVVFDRAARIATVILRGCDEPAPDSAEAMIAQGAPFCPPPLPPQPDDALLTLRLN